MHNLKIYPYRMGSESAKDLAKYLDIKRVYPDGDYIPRIGHVILNWGSSRTPDWAPKAASRNVRILNKPAAVGTAGNKLKTLSALRAAGISVPDFTTHYGEAMQWLDNDETVVERGTLTGNSGEGIRIVSHVDFDDDYIEDHLYDYSPLWTKFIPKTAEFRVHVFRGSVIDYIEKKKMASERRPANFNRHVSSVNLGWVFARNNIMDSPEVKRIAIDAVNALGLDFGAVDVVYYEGRPYVLEVNTAPGLTGTTLINYLNAFRRYMGAGALIESQINEIMSQADEGINHTEVAAESALDEPQTSPNVLLANPTARAGATPTHSPNSGDVLLRLDRSTALKLKSLLEAQLM